MGGMNQSLIAHTKLV